MHLPGTKKSEKRKASVVSVGDEVPVAKDVKREKKKAKSRSKSTLNQRKDKKDTMTPDPQLQPSSPRSPNAPPPTMSSSSSSSSSSDRVDSVTESPPTSTPLAHAHTDPTPRRSSRIKNSLHSVAQTWDKARPYIERINGTIMPLEPQAGAEVYYKRDGLR